MVNGTNDHNPNDAMDLIGLPATTEYIAYHAGHRPDAIAVIDGDRRFTFVEFHEALRRVTGALRSFELAIGSFVAVEWTTLSSHWLILLAFENLGVATITFLRGEGSGQAYFDRMHLVMTTKDWGDDCIFRTHRLTPDWFDAALSGIPASDMANPKLTPESPHQIVHTSGTTGTSKLMVRTRRNHEFLTGTLGLHCGLTQNSRYLMTMGLNIASVYRYATICIRHGGTCIWDRDSDLAQALARHRATQATLLPVALTELLDNIPEQYEKPSDLTVTMIGAPVAKAVRERVLELLANELLEGYSTNETGRVCTMNDEGTGTVWPGVHVEVVDSDDRPVQGKEGLVRIKSEGCASGYMDDPEASREMFRNGWFYPGDLGIMLGPRTLKIIGRADDVLNVRGVKFLPYAAEERMASELPVEEICISVAADAEGQNHICIVFAPEDSLDCAKAADRLSKYIPPEFGQFHIVPMGEILKTSTGKFKRKALSAGTIFCPG